jgi:hypothetical protein
MTRARELAELASAYDAGGLGFRNRIINGDMRIDVRNSGASVTPSGGYTLDRWSCLAPSGSGHTVQQVSDAPAGFTNSLRFTVGTGAAPTSGQQNILWQPIEGFNVSDFGLGTSSAITFTAGFWVRASVTGTYGVWFQNTGSLRSYISQITINNANTWEYKTVTVSGDTSGTWLKNNGIGLMFGLSLGAGSTFQTAAGSWAAGDFKTSSSAVSIVATSGATLQITGVQLEAGSVASPFERRDYGRELIMCQRYYESIATTTNTAAAAGQAFTNANVFIPIPFKVTKRSEPTFSFTGNYIVLTANGASAGGVLTLGGSSVDTARLNIASASGLVAGNVACLFANSSGCALNFSSEL